MKYLALNLFFRHGRAAARAKVKEKRAPIEGEERWLREEFLCTMRRERTKRKKKEKPIRDIWRMRYNGFRVCISNDKLWRGVSRKTLQREK